MIALVGALAIGGTIAFYNDTETSAGNIFVAGSIDLKVDHLAQTYNGVDCATCDVTVVSDTSNLVVKKNGVPITPYNAEALTFIHSAWTASIPGATWIWENNPVQQADVITDVTYTFQKQFTWFGPFTGAAVDFSIASDNSYEVYLNGTLIDADSAENNFSAADNVTVDLTPYILQGTNTLEFEVKNWAQPAGNPSTNPAGLLYKVHIDGDCGDSYFLQHCSLFSETNLTNQTFFNFDDIKPADEGTNVISLHVDDNDAHACLIVHDTDDQENSLLEPETDMGDDASTGNLDGFGELSDYLDLFVWNDLDGDGDYEPTGETSIYEGNIQTELIQLTLTGGGPTEYVGLAWCAGNIQVNHTTGAIGCDGAGMLNDAQSDSLTASLTAYAEQVRNNEDFDCEDVVLPPTNP